MYYPLYYIVVVISANCSPYPKLSTSDVLTTTNCLYPHKHCSHVTIVIRDGRCPDAGQCYSWAFLHMFLSRLFPHFHTPSGAFSCICALEAPKKTSSYSSSSSSLGMTIPGVGQVNHKLLESTCSRNKSI